MMKQKANYVNCFWQDQHMSFEQVPAVDEPDRGAHE